MKQLESKKTLKQLWQETPFFPHPLDKGIYTLTGKVPLPKIYFENWIVTRELKTKNTSDYVYRPMLIDSDSYMEPIAEGFDSLNGAKLALIEYLTLSNIPFDSPVPVTSLNTPMTEQTASH